MRISDWSSDVCSSDLVGAGLHGDQHALGSQQRGARQGGNARRAVDDDVIGPPGEFWRLLVQRFACKAHGAEQPWQALLASALCPVQRRSEEHTSELPSLMRISYAVFCLKKKNINKQ